MRATGHGPPRRDPGENARRRLWHEVPGLALDSARAAVGHAVGVFFNDPRRRGVPLAWPGDPGYVFELVDVWRISHEDVAREEADNIYLEWADAARELEEVAEPNAWYGWDRLAWALAFLAASVETPLEEGLLDPRWASYESYEEAALQEAEGALADLYSLRVPSPTGLPGPVNVRISRLRARRELAEAIRREVVPRLLA